MQAILEAIHVGRPKRMGTKGSDDPWEQEWYSGIYKQAAAGPIWLGATNLEGDGQADKRVHGGPNRAVLCYSADHYSVWREELGDLGMNYGMFGENFTIAGLNEGTVCMGDVYAVGEARIQVSQLRGPCWKLARRVGRRDMVERVLMNGRSGWYVRVLKEGHVEAGQTVQLESREADAPTMLEIHAARHWRTQPAL